MPTTQISIFILFGSAGSSGKGTILRQTKKILNKNYSKQIFHTHKKIYIF